MEFHFYRTMKLDDAFFNRNWAGVCAGLLGRTRIGVGRVHKLYVVGPGCVYCSVNRPALEVKFLYKKNEKKGVGEGFARGRSDA